MPNFDPKRGRELLIDCRGGESAVYGVSAGTSDPVAAFVAMCWYKMPSDGELIDGQRLLAAAASGVTNNEWALFLDANGSLGADVGGADFDSDDTGLVDVDDVWHWLAVSYDGDEAADDDKGRVYLDGALVATSPTGTAPATINLTANDIGVGAGNDGNNPANAIIRSAVVVPAAATLAQINQMAMVLQAKNAVYAQQAITRMLGAAPILHVQPSWEGSLTNAPQETILRDLSPNGFAVTPSADLALIPKDRHTLVAGQV